MNRLAWHGRSILRRVDKQADSLPRRIAETIADHARRVVPVKTGHLKSTIKATKDGVEVTADYAAAVELGTARRAAQPFIRPAIEMLSKSDMNRIVN